MNATQSIDTCRKIVRNIISDARKLKEIADERDVEKQKEEQQRLLEEKLANDPKARRQYEREQKEAEEEKEKAAKKRKKKKKRKKIPGIHLFLLLANLL